MRKLRSAFGHRVVPGLTGSAGRHGVPRAFTDFEGFGSALAAALLDAGLTRQVVARALCSATRPSANERPLFRTYEATACTLEIEDWCDARVSVPKCRGIGPALGTGWLPLAGPTRERAEPALTVRITADLGALARAVLGRA